MKLIPFGITALGGLMLLAYQNCSQVSFQGSGFSSGVSALEESQQPQVDPSEPGTQKPADTPPELSNRSSANCREAMESQADATLVAAGGVIDGVRGEGFFKSDSLAAVTNSQGQIRILGLKADSKILSLSGAIGNIYICNMDIDRIENMSQGRLIIVGGNVGDIDNFSGQIDIYDGAILGKVTNSNGNIDTH